MIDFGIFQIVLFLCGVGIGYGLGVWERGRVKDNDNGAIGG